MTSCLVALVNGGVVAIFFKKKFMTLSGLNGPSQLPYSTCISVITVALSMNSMKPVSKPLSITL
jgi:hypothetical protein